MKNFFLKLGICALALTGAAEALAQEQVIQLFAHRGSRFEYDENTLPAFKASYDAGLRGFETDIRMTRDGAVLDNQTTGEEIHISERDAEKQLSPDGQPVQMGKRDAPMNPAEDAPKHGRQLRPQEQKESE